MLRGGLLGDELAAHPEFANRVAEFIDIIATHGPTTAAAEAITRTP
ncbi:hypothetical protein AB0L13_06425 [Saccharopolyspora shandongensis]